MTDTTLISLSVALMILTGAFILVGGGWLAFVVYLIVLFHIFGFA